MHSALREWQMLFSVLPHNFRQSRIRCSSVYCILIYRFVSAVPEKFIRGALKVWSGWVFSSLLKRGIVSTVAHLCHVLGCDTSCSSWRDLHLKQIPEAFDYRQLECVCTSRIGFCPGWANKIRPTLHSYPWNAQASWQPLAALRFGKREGRKFIKKILIPNIEVCRIFSCVKF